MADLSLAWPLLFLEPCGSAIRTLPNFAAMPSAPTNVRQKSSACGALFRQARRLLVGEQMIGHDESHNGKRDRQERADRPPQPGPERNHQKNRERIERQT